MPSRVWTVGEGFLHLQPVDDEDTGGRLDELLELVGKPAGLVQELGGHQGRKGLFVDHPLAQIVGLPVQAAHGRQASHRCAGGGDAHLPGLHPLNGRVQQWWVWWKSSTSWARSAPAAAGPG
ncbi:hypothetical protein O1L68_39910 [Streptomyces lydicus]|nr:hypothetical protein [Streptomyces lydicus]